MTAALDKNGMQKNMGSLKKKKKNIYIYIYISETKDDMLSFLTVFSHYKKGTGDYLNMNVPIVRNMIMLR